MCVCVCVCVPLCVLAMLCVRTFMRACMYVCACLCRRREEALVVDYSVTVLVSGAGVSPEQLDYLTLQSNRVENSHHLVEERPTLVFTVSKVRIHGGEALHKTDAESGERPAGR